MLQHYCDAHSNWVLTFKRIGDYFQKCGLFFSQTKFIWMNTIWMNLAFGEPEPSPCGCSRNTWSTVTYELWQTGHGI
jgi:hypothetical protein